MFIISVKSQERELEMKQWEYKSHTLTITDMQNVKTPEEDG